MKLKNKLVTADTKEVFIIFFIHEESKSIIFLAYNADIDSICYNDTPKLPGTTNIKLAKRYETLDEASNDVYKLRYHHRDFLKTTVGIKRIYVSEFGDPELLDGYTGTYNITDLD